MKKLPIGIQTFSEIIQNDYVYIDKTMQIHQLIESGKYYFLSRPRRFGKSLLLSTLCEVFKGNKDLFTGLAIEQLLFAWKSHPVVLISFSDVAHMTPQDLKQSLRFKLDSIAADNNIELPKDLLLGDAFQVLVKTLARSNQVVLLIDEYDYPILQHAHDIAVAQQMRDILKGFYGVIKGLDQHLKFVLLTGVSKFSQTSIFSGLNNLNDITLDDRFAYLLGYTRQDIATYLPDYLQQASEHFNVSTETMLDQIAEWYDGYSFAPHVRHADDIRSKIYNPFSVLMFFQKMHFSNYWFKSGTPSFLIKLLKERNYPLQEYENVKASAHELDTFDIDAIPLKTLLFQTGYITIKAYDFNTEIYTLGYPNREVSRSLVDLIFTSMTQRPDNIVKDLAYRIRMVFEHNKLLELMPLLTQFFADIPYHIHITQERYYHTIFYLILKMVGADVLVEQSTNIGRIDAVVHTERTIFIIEFKINTSAAQALHQIEEKKYFQPYQAIGKNIVLVGIAFDTASKNVKEIECKELLNS